MKIHELGNKFDLEYRQKLNENFKNLNNNVENVIDKVVQEAFEKVVDSAKIEWLPPVNTFNDLEITYPNVTEGKTAMVRDSGKIYRFTNEEWLEIQDIDPTIINAVETQIENHINDLPMHVSNEDRLSWDSKETPESVGDQILIAKTELRNWVNQELQKPLVWSEITLQNGVQSFSDGWRPRVAKRADIVYIKGAVKNITARNLVVATLPPELWPVTSHAYVQSTSLDSSSRGRFARWAISTSGQIIIEGTTNNEFGADLWFPITCSYPVS
ncbi:hypothetical protein ABFV99_14800 [Cytobacillus horneckiae]|uniref:hypothetical protein n=1 Tax=Cytobacillus horneckiae TaxID=549687 RepID=UPI0034CFA02C